jgi:ubiquinone/menaquinone biosynthesis C-methylase UbiE
MSTQDEFRRRARATWSAGNWDNFADMLSAVGQNVLDRMSVGEGQTLLDVGTGSGGTISIPAAERGAKVTGLDVTPELFEHARRRAADAGVEVEWVEGDAADLPFDDASFDIVTSTFGAMFAPEHAKAASELVRVCRPGGRVAMTTWAIDGQAGELFKLTGKFMPPPPPGIGTPPQWGTEDHIREMFSAAGVTPEVTQEAVTFEFESLESAVEKYATEFGPFVMARGMLEPQGRWDEFLTEFSDLLARFNTDSTGALRVKSDYLLITVAR